MGWKDLLEQPNDNIVLPWVGGSELVSKDRSWVIEGRLPPEYGWYRFKLLGRRATVAEKADPVPELLRNRVKGFLVGDRLMGDSASSTVDLTSITEQSETVFLLDDGLDRFVRVCAGRIYPKGLLIYCNQEMPSGQEDAVLAAFYDRRDSLNHLRDIPPALDAAFRLETWRRIEVARLRAEAEARRKAEEERLAKEARHREMLGRLGDSVARREVALLDFAAGATAALAAGGAEYLDHRKGVRKTEMIVTFLVQGRRFECVCAEDMRIIDSGICLTDHATGVKGDTRFTLESLPSVIMEARLGGRLHVYRHVDGDQDWDDDDPDRDWDD